jgi:hypothetical protein
MAATKHEMPGELGNVGDDGGAITVLWRSPELNGGIHF